MDWRREDEEVEKDFVENLGGKGWENETGVSRLAQLRHQKSAKFTRPLKATWISKEKRSFIRRAVKEGILLWT